MKVSVVIPTFNAGLAFEDLLEGLVGQEGDFEVEILVVDSGSTDGTSELADRYGATVHRIRSQDFNHGATRNLGISLARGEYVALTVQDAVPLDERWLLAMVQDLEQDEQVAGVYGRQVPQPGSGPLTRVVINNIATAGLERREQYAGSPKRYRELPAAERRSLAAFDNVTSCVRRSAWEEIPFDETDFGEDLRWGKKVIEAGYKIVYEPRSAVFHSHERGAMYELRRNYVNQLVVSELFELNQVPNLARLLVAISASSLHVFWLLYRGDKRTRRWLRDSLRFVLLAVRHALPSQTGVYLGGKSRSLARLSPGLHRRIDRFLSKGI